MRVEPFPVADYEYDRDTDVIDSGSFGVIYSAYSRTRGEHVALKHVRGSGKAGEDRVQAEGRGAELQELFAEHHPHVVPVVHEHGRSDSGDYYIAMEFLRGTSLSVLIGEGRIPPPRAAEIARWIASEFLTNLHSLHERATGLPRQIVHSDLKPDHIIILNDQTLRALDFGITKGIQPARTSTVNPFATIPYASPRRLRDGIVDVDSDIWALGVILYESVVGHHIYPDLRYGDQDVLSRAIQRQEPIAPIVGCPTDLASIIRKVLAPDRSQAYSSAGELASDLGLFLVGRRPVACAQVVGASVPTLPVEEANLASLTDPFHLTSTPEPPTGDNHLAAHPVERASAPSPLWLRRTLQSLAALVVLGVLSTLALEAIAVRKAETFRARIPTLQIPDVTDLRSRLRDIQRRSPLGLAVAWRLSGPLSERLRDFGFKPLSDYRSGIVGALPNWQGARDSLRLALDLDPNNARLVSAIRTIDAHQLRARSDVDQAEAVRAFREAADLDPTWPDPYLGLAAIHADRNIDFDALIDDLREAAIRGHVEGPRERTQLGRAYRQRADNTLLRAKDAPDVEKGILLRQALNDYQDCSAKLAGLETYKDMAALNSYCRSQFKTVGRQLETDRGDALSVAQGRY